MRKMLRPVFVLLCLTFSSQVFAQDGDYRTRQTGNWNAATTWQVRVGGVFQDLESPAAGIYQFQIPSDASGAIELANNVTINTAVTADQITVTAGTTTVAAPGVFTIEDDAGDDVIVTGGAISITTGSMSFVSGASYLHNRNGGSVPNASWAANSTCTITGITNTAPTINNATVFHHFTWNCSSQSAIATIGLREVNGDLIIENSNNQIVRFATGTAYTMNIDGDFTLNNSSRVAFGTTAAGIVVNLAGDFNHNTSGVSLLKSSGTYTFNISGDLAITSGTLRMSTGGNTGTINVAGATSLDPGAIIDETGTGDGRIVFNGTLLQSATLSGTITGTIGFEVNNAAHVQLESTTTIPGALTQTQGNLILNGNILTLNGNFTQTSGSLVVDPSSEFIIGGTGTLPALISFSGVDIRRIRMNRTGATLATSSDLTTDFIDLYAGDLNHTGTLTMVDGGIIERRVGNLTNPVTAGGQYDVIYNNTTAAVTTGPELPINTGELNNLTIQGGQTVNLAGNITINGNLTTTAGVFAAAANSIDLVGNFISNAGFTTTAGGNFTVSGMTSTLTGGGSTPVFRNLFVTGIFTPSVNFQVNENLNVSGTLNATAGTASFGGAASVITNSGSLTFFGFDLLTASTVTFPAGTVRVNGNFDISTGTSTFNNGGGTIEFGGTTNLLGTGTKTFNNVTVLNGFSFSGAVSWGFNGALVNDGTISFTAGLCSTNNAASISGTGSTTFFDLDVVGGTLTLAAATSISLLDDFDISAGTTFTAGANSTVSFITAACLITGTGTKNFSNINVPSGGTLSHGVIVNVAGNITVDGTLANGSGTTVFNGGGTSTISGSGTIGFDFLTVNAGTSVNVTSNITITDDITANGNLTSTQTVTITAATVVLPASGVVTFNNLTINPGITFTPNDNIILNGNLTVSGTLSDGTANAIVEFAGTSTVSGAATAINFPFLTITGTLTAHPTVTMNVERDFTNNGTFNHNGGTINFNTSGTAQQQILGSQAITFNNLSVSNVGVATDLTNGNAAGITIVGTLSFTEGAAVFDADGAGSNLLTLASSADSPASDGRIGAIPAGSNVSGNFTVQRYVSAEAGLRFWRYIASPVVGATVAQLQSSGLPVTGVFSDPSSCTGCLTTSPSMFSFEETREPPYVTNATTRRAYEAFPTSAQSSSAVLANGDGYSVYFRQDLTGVLTLSFRGTNPSPAGVTLPVAPTVTAGDGGYSLVGNPYPSAIDWASATGWSSRAGFSNIAVVRDNATGVHQFLDAGSPTPQLIAPGQSFWVQTLAGGSSLTVNENAKATGNYSFFRLDQPMEDILELTLTKGTTGTTDNARIVIREGSTSLYDKYDQYKFNNNIDDGTTITEVQDISTLTAEATPKALGVNAIPSICSQTFNVRVTNFVNAGETVVNYTLGINASGAMGGVTWILHDTYTNSQHNLTTLGAYHFTVNNSIAASKNIARFYIEAISPTIDTNKTVTAASPIVCVGSDAMITLAASQSGVAYGVEVNGTYYPNVVMGTGGDVNIFLDQDKLQNINSILVKANSGCQLQAVGNPVEINQVPLYQATVASPNPLCVSGSVTLTAEGAPADAVVRWYDSPTGSTVMATGTTYSPVISETTSFYASVVNAAGCEGARTEVQAQLIRNEATVEIILNSDAVCASDSITYFNKASVDGGEFIWYNANSQRIATVPANDLLKLRVDKATSYTVYYAPVAGLPTCLSDAMTVMASVLSTVNDLDQHFASNTVCAGQSHTITASGAPAGSTYRWYNHDKTATLATGLSFTTPALPEGGQGFYVSAVGPNGCESNPEYFFAPVAASNPVVNVSHNLAAVPVCQDTESEVTLTNTEPGMSYRWYDSQTSLEPIHEGTTLPATIFAEKQSYYVGAVNASGCETQAASRKGVTVDVIKFTEPVLDNSVYGVLKSTTAQSYQWYVNGDPIPGEQDQLIRVFDPGYYAVKVDLLGCEAWSNTIFTTDLITSLTDESRVIRFFPNPTSDKLTVHVLGHEPVVGQLLDEQGRSIASIHMMQEEGQWSGELDVRSLARGFYLLRLSSGSKSVTHKVIIK